MQYGLKNIFRFYDDKEKQNRYYPYVHGNITTWRLSTPTTLLPSFQIQVATGKVIGDVTVYLVDLDDAETDITAYFDITGNDATLYIQDFDDFEYLIYNASKALETSIGKGTWYLKIDVDSVLYYSEVFCVVDTSGYLSIEYYNSSDVDSIDYTNGDYEQYTNKLLINTKLTKAEYEYEEEGTENGDGEFLPTFMKRTKRYKFVFYAPEYILDAITLIPMHSSVTVITDSGEGTTETITVARNKFYVNDIFWTDTKGFAKVSCEFWTDPVVVTNYANNVT